MTKLLVLVPAGNPPSALAELSLRSIKRFLSDSLDLAVIGPPITTRPLGEQGFTLVETPHEYWENPDSRGMQALLCSRGLYSQLAAAGYSHVLLHHLDTVTVRPAIELAPYLHAQYDLIGAPCWGIAGAMNSGFSIRRIEACLDALDGLGQWVSTNRYWQEIGINEDVWWSTKARIRVPPSRLLGIPFAWDNEPELCHRLNNYNLPIGIHQPGRYDPSFWERLGGARALVNRLIG